MKNLLVLAVAAVLILLGGITSASGAEPIEPEPSFVVPGPADPICGLYPGWEPGDVFGVGEGDVIDCPPPEGPAGPNPSGEPTVLSFSSETDPAPVPVPVVSVPRGPEITPPPTDR